MRCRRFFFAHPNYGYGFARIRGYGASCNHIPAVFVPVRFLHLRIARGVYDCRRECAFALRLLPVIKSLACERLDYGRSDLFGAQPLRGRHTPSRHHAVCAVSIPLRASTAGDGWTALSYAPRHPPPPSAARRKDIPAQFIAFHSCLSSLATSIIPPFIDQRCEHIVYCPNPKPLVGRGCPVLEATDGEARRLPSKRLTAAVLERECAYAL